MSKIITVDFSGKQFDFRDDGWFNATLAAEKFGKKPNEWLRLPETERYINALCKKFETGKSRFVITKKGGDVTKQGTWLHPKLAVAFARWLDLDFSIWCDDQIDNLLRGNNNWHKLRHEAASSFKVMNAVLLLQRQMQGKTSAAHHFSNEARLINWALSGKYEGLDRDSLTPAELDLLAKLEERNAVLIGCGVEYSSRKPLLEKFVQQYKQPLALDSVA